MRCSFECEAGKKVVPGAIRYSSHRNEARESPLRAHDRATSSAGNTSAR